MTTKPSPGSRFLGESALVATLSVPRQRKKGGPDWQYHPRSDHHSKVSCLLMALDLMIASRVLREAIASGKVACGINHVMMDHKKKLKKAFDLVFHRPAEGVEVQVRQTFKSLLKLYGVALTAAQQAQVDKLPDIPVHPVAANSVYIAFEAKACMTEYGKARPRLYAELSSSYPIVHGDSENAIAAAFVLVNASKTFVSPLRNPAGASGAVVTHHNQPHDWHSVIDKVRDLQLRSAIREEGFDAVGIVAINLPNDHTAATLVDDPAALQNYQYDQMIDRVAYLYEARFPR